LFSPLPPAYWLPPLATGIGAAVLATLVWVRRPSQPAAALALYLLSVAVWSIGYCLQLTAPTLAQQVFWSKVEYLGPAGVSLAGLFFVLQYSGLNDWVRPSRIVLLSVIPAVTQVLVWTNERHGLIWRSVWLESSGPYRLMARTHGPWFWVFLTYGYALCLIAILLLIRELFSRRGIYRSQVAVLLVGCLVPFAGNVMYSFGFNLVPNLDFTVFGFSITGLSMAWGLFRFQLPVIMPIARQTVFDGMSDAVIALDIAGNVVEVNPEASRMLERPAGSVIGRPAVAAFRQYPDLAEFCAHPQEGRTPLTIESLGLARRFDAKCSLLKTRRQRVIGSLIVLRDVTDREAAEESLREAHSLLEQRIAERTVDLSRTIEELRQLENQLTFNACHDGLTGLANRRLFLDRVTHRLEIHGNSAMFAILYVDLDRFKVYNDGYGHHLGDLILVEIGQRLKNCLRPSDTVARMGGDEFTILLEEVDNVTEASRLAQECLQALAAPARIGGNEIHLTASIGIVVSLGPRRSAGELVRDADLAMYRAKRQGGNRAILFGLYMRSSALLQVQLEQDLRLAVPRDEMMVQYQPFVHMQTGKVVGFEALVRWRHPERGILQPAEFLPLAEQTETLIAIDEFVLGEACRRKASWESANGSRAEPAFVSVNVAGWQFSHPQRWWQALSALNAQGAGLRLEMVESVLLANAHGAADFFQEVRARNLEVYLDDFGTGYSSLSRLSHFPIRSLKIGRSFVKDLVVGGRDISIVRAIIALAHSLDMEVVAEGIECANQSEILRDLGCEYGQGFYFSRPVDGSATLAMLN
jgi:diguanylate cyclase (GGDEF)-like protein